MPTHINDAIEWIAVLFGVVSVMGNIKMQRWAWLVQIASSVLYCYVFWVQKLYGLAGLQWYFIGIAVWAFWTWQPSSAANAVRIESLRHRSLLIIVALGLFGAIALALVLAHWTNSQAAYADAFTTVGSVIAQWLMSRYFIQTWHVWAVVNAVSVGLFASTGLWPTAALYGLFFVMAVLGLLQWNKLLASSKKV